MEEKEKIIALKHIIFSFAQNQFAANGITSAEAAIIMEAITGQFQKACLESVIMGMVTVSDPGSNDEQDCVRTAEDMNGAATALSEILDAVSAPLSNVQKAHDSKHEDNIPVIEEEKSDEFSQNL